MRYSNELRESAAQTAMDNFLDICRQNDVDAIVAYAFHPMPTVAEPNPSTVYASDWSGNAVHAAGLTRLVETNLTFEFRVQTGELESIAEAVKEKLTGTGDDGGG